MKMIPLKSAKSLGFERHFVSFAFKHPRISVLYDRAIVDTGCPFIIMSENVIKTRRMLNSYAKYR